MLYVDPELEDALDGRRVRAQVRDRRRRATCTHEAREPEPWEHEENATATINYTSGTTARPKGVQITHRNIWTNAVTFALHTGVTDRDVYLHTLPMFHANGWGMPFAMTGMGVPQVVIRKIDGAEILRRVEKYGVTVMCAAPAVVASVLDAAETWEGEIPGRDRVRIIVAGAPPPTKTVARVEAELGWEFIQIYGLTETSPLLTINRTRAEWDDLSGEERAPNLVRAGQPAIGVTLKVSDSGEVLARSNVVLEGYWEQPEESEASLADGWFHTGDGGVIGDDGYLTIQDRKKDVIITGGENVSSIEVEDVIFSHPDVAEVAVIGVARREVGRDDQGAGGQDRGLRDDRAGPDRLLQVQGRALQGAVLGRVPRGAGPDGHRQAAEVQAAQAVLGGSGAAGQLARPSVGNLAPCRPWVTSPTCSRSGSLRPRRQLGRGGPGLR